MWLKLQEGSLHEENPSKTHKIYAVTPVGLCPVGVAWVGDKKQNEELCFG